jgi:NAD(P)-dependent dehydrogenase (short-subunit alcohol dehydrogenase family)
MSEDHEVAIVIGASQGIGAGLVKAIRDRNYRIVANSRSIERSADPDLLTIAGDIAKPETAKRIIEECMCRFGRVDSLVNNAGIFIGKNFTSYTLVDFSNLLAVNLAGFFHITQAAIAEMARVRAQVIRSKTLALVDSR